MSKTVIKGAQVLVDGAFIDAEVQLENGVITAIGQNLEGEVIAAEGYLLPGLIDEHIHGIYGSDTMYGAEAVCNMSKRLAMHGVTGFLPTTMNAGVK